MSEKEVEKTSDEVEYEEAVRAVKSFDNKAKTKLARFKLSGRGGAEVDEDGAVALLTERVKDNDSDAMWMLGLCYEYEMGCEQDVEEAERLYKRSSDGGNVIGDFLVGNGKDDRGSGVMKVKSLQIKNLKFDNENSDELRNEQI